MELAAAIDGLYVAFAGYPRPQRWKGCGCGGCWPDNIYERVRPDAIEVWVPAPGDGRPLREVAANDAESVLELVPMMGGTLDILKHYLPLALEVLAVDGLHWLDVEVALGRLGHGPDLNSVPWTEWPEPERDAIREYLHALWIATISVDDVNAIADVLCGVGLIDPDFGWYLDAWPTPSHQARGIVQSNSFWDESRSPAPENRRRLLEWVAESYQ